MENVNVETTAQDSTNAVVTNEAITDANATAPVESKPASDTTAVDTKPTEVELKLPEGTLLKPETVEQIKSLAKEKNLSNEVAQELLNREHLALDSFHKQQVELVEKTKQVWAEESKKDAEIGGDNFGRNLELAKRALEKFATPKFIQEIDSSGYGNHPEVIRIFTRIGKMIANDSLVMANSHGASSAKSLEDVFYGKEN